MRRGFAAALFLLAFGGWDWLQSKDPDVKDGNEAFASGEFGQALSLYERSKASGGSSEAIRFDMGAALYKLALAETDDKQKAELLERAETAFREAAESSDRVLRSAAYHNLGNTMFVRERWAAAADGYKKALRTNQENDDARYNLELVLRRQKNKQGQTGQRGKQGNQPKRPGQGQQEKPQGSDGGNKDQNDPSGQSQSPQPQGQGQQSQDNQSGQGSDQSNQPKPGQGQQKGDPSQGSQNPQTPPPSPGQGDPANQNQSGQTAPSAPKPGGGADPSADGKPTEGAMEPGDGESKTDRDRKLDALENRSRDLRKRRLRRGGSSGQRGRFNRSKDW